VPGRDPENWKLEGSNDGVDIITRPSRQTIGANLM